MLKKMILALTVLTLSACAFDKDASKNNAKEVEETQRQKSTYDPITGVYTGQLRTPSNRQDISITLFTLAEPVAPNSDRDDGFRWVLRANYKKINPVGMGYSLKARFIPETGQLILTNENISKGTIGMDDVHTIEAKIVGQRIIGEAKSITGVIGTVELNMTSNEAAAPGNNEEAEYYERLRQQYESIAGVYAGDNVVNGKVTFSFKISLQVIREGLVPKLVGEFNRDDDPTSSVSLSLSGIYQPDLTPATLTLSGKPRFNSNNSSYAATFEGTIVNGVYKGSWFTNTRGAEGSFTLKKMP